MARQSPIMTLLLLLLFSLGTQVLDCHAGPVQEQQEERFAPAAGEPLVVDELHYISPRITSAQLLRARGYLAQEFKFTTPDNYILSITRGTNPLINEGKRGHDNKLPILFINASLLGSRSYLVNSENVRPRSYNDTNLDLSTMDTGQLLELVGDDPAVNNLAFLAMNFGYECWLLDRRGFGLSRGIAGRPNRTLADAWASIPASLLVNAVGGFSLDGNLNLGRPNRVPAPPPRTANDTSGAPEADLASGSALEEDIDAAQFPLPFTSGQGDRDDLGELWRQLLKQGSAANSLDSLATLRQDFIDTFDPEYWNFSIDEQAEGDFPAAIDFVLQQTGKPKLHTVGLSCGGAIILMSLAGQPELAEKISRAVLWAPAVNLGSKSDIDYQASFVYPLVQTYQGPVPFLFQSAPLQTAFQAICVTELAQSTICESIIDLPAGFSCGQQPARPWLLSALLQSTASGEASQLGQFTRTDVPCKFKYNTDAKNIAKYGQKTPPCYDLGQIKLSNMSIYVGGHDTLVSPDDVQTTVSQLTVPVEVNYIRGNGVYFNHIGFLSHKNVAQLAILPSLLDFERSQALERT